MSGDILLIYPDLKPLFSFCCKKPFSLVVSLKAHNITVESGFNELLEFFKPFASMNRKIDLLFSAVTIGYIQ